MSNIFSLEGKIALVTGASGLLGKQHCIALAEAGATVIAADIHGDKIHLLTDELPVKVTPMRLDITDTASLSSVRERIMETFGTIDILINNAAVNDMVENNDKDVQSSSFEHYPLYLWKKVMDVNVTGVFLTCQYFGAIMAKKNYGSIINIASTYGIVAPDQSIYVNSNGERFMWKSPSYPTTKGAVIQFTKYLAAYWGKNNVRVNALSPGGVENNQDADFISNYSNKTPLGRMSHNNDYHGAIVFLASDASSYMTGANLVVDGGWTII